MANDKYSEDFADNIRNLMETNNLPHIKIVIENIKTSYTESKTPLTVLSAKIEAVVNVLLWDVYTTDMMEAGFLLHQLEDQIESLMALGSYLRLRHDGGASTRRRPQPQSKSKEEPQEPIPKIFSDILKDLATKSTPKKAAKADKPAPKKAAKAKKATKPRAKKAEKKDK